MEFLGTDHMSYHEKKTDWFCGFKKGFQILNQIKFFVNLTKGFLYFMQATWKIRLIFDIPEIPYCFCQDFLSKQLYKSWLNILNLIFKGLFFRAYSELQTCLSPLREACKDDVTWASVTGMETSYGPMCGGGGAGTGGAGTDGTGTGGAGPGQACDFWNSLLRFVLTCYSYLLCSSWIGNKGLVLISRNWWCSFVMPLPWKLVLRNFRMCSSWRCYDVSNKGHRGWKANKHFCGVCTTWIYVYETASLSFVH